MQIDPLPTAAIAVFSNRRMSLGKSVEGGGGSCFLVWILNQSSSRRRGGGNVGSAPLVFALSQEERKLPEHGLQHRLQPGLADAGAGGNDLPWRDLIDGVDVIDAFASRRIALMDSVDAQIAGLTLRIRPPPGQIAP